MAFASVLFVLGAIGFLWLIYFNAGDAISPIEKEFAELNNSPIKNTESYSGSKLILDRRSTRGNDVANELLKRTLSDKILFQIPIESDDLEPETFSIEIIKNDKVIFRQTAVPSTIDEENKKLNFQIPSNILDVGKYELKLQSNRNNNNSLEFVFSVK